MVAINAPAQPQSEAAGERHLFIAGTGRAGTSFLVRYLTGLGLDTHISRRGGGIWDEQANAGLEDVPVGQEDLPYVIKSPWLSQYLDELIAGKKIRFDAVIIPMRDLVEAAVSRTVLELRAMHQAAPWMAEFEKSWETWGLTAGGAVFSLNPIDQGRILAVGFHRLIEQLVQAEVPIIFLAFPRLVQDADYLFEKLRPILPKDISPEQARDAHRRIADKDKVRVGAELGQETAPTGVTAGGPLVKYPEHEALDAIALRRELSRLRGDLANRTGEAERLRQEFAKLSEEVQRGAVARENLELRAGLQRAINEIKALRQAKGGVTVVDWPPATPAAATSPAATSTAPASPVAAPYSPASPPFELGAAAETVDERLARAAHEAAELRAVIARKDREMKDLRDPSVVIHTPSNRLPQPLAVEDAFPQWIERRASTAVARDDWVAERVQLWPAMPKLALGMIVPAGSEERALFTLKSLRAQRVGDWTLHVVAEGPAPAAFAGELCLSWQAAGRAVGRLNQSLVESGADWVALIDAGDQLAPHALFAVADAFYRHSEWLALYSDEDRIDPAGTRANPHFKPDFNLDLMRSMPYIGGIVAVRQALFAELGGFGEQWDGTEEYDLALRLAERLGGAAFGHVADILYHRLTISGRSKRPIQAICADMPKVLQAHLDRAGVKATAASGVQPHFCRVAYHHDGPEPMVSIIVPTKNQLALVKRCVEVVLQKTKYENYELIIVDNGSTEADACAFLDQIETQEAQIGTRIRVLRHPGPFNFSVMNNRAVRESARGEYICLLNNDAAPLDGDWLGEMMAHARRPEVGIVGAKLFYPDGRIQHGGVILGVGWGSPADHPYSRDPGESFGYWGRLQVVQDFSVVTAACMVTRRSIWEAIGGLDETRFAVAYNDVDYCLKVRERGHLVVWTPYARLLHEASASLKTSVEGKAVKEKNERFFRERQAMYERWMPRIAFDPAYNRNLSSFGYGFAVESEGAPTWDPEFRPRERVLIYPADREGCGEYRIIAPGRALFRAGELHVYETMRLFTPPEVTRMAPDSIVFQRQLEWNQIEVIERVKNTSDAFRIFEIDDLITNLPLKSAHRPSIAADIGQRMKKALALCDRLVVSTEPLAQQYGKLCAETVVLPNRLERARWGGLEPGRRSSGKPRVGWAGAIGHLGDLSLIASVVEATAKEVDWVFFGMCPDKLKAHVAEVHDWVPLYDYAKKLAALDLDLAIAPLEHNAFNEAKSNLRLLEYGVLGYPVICTDVLPYQGKLPVVRVANRHRDWTRAIREMAADREACHRAGAALRAAVLADWMLEDHLDEVKRAWLRPQGAAVGDKR